MQTNMSFPTYVFATVNSGRSTKVVEELKRNSQMALGVSVLTCEHNTSGSVIKQLSSIPGFIEATTVPGQFDIVALWQAKTSEDIVKNSVERVTTLPGVFKSETLLAYAPFFKA